MRILLSSVLVLACAGAAFAQAPASAPVAGALQSYDVPASGQPQTVSIVRRVLKPGDVVPLHTHDGTEITQVVQGDFELTVEGKPTVYHGGDSFIVPRGVQHSGKNVGTTDVILAATYVLDKSAPLMRLVK